MFPLNIEDEISLYAGTACDVIGGNRLIPLPDGNTVVEDGHHRCFGNRYVCVNPHYVGGFSKVTSYDILDGSIDFECIIDNQDIGSVMPERPIQPIIIEDVSHNASRFTRYECYSATWRATFLVGSCGLTIPHTHNNLVFEWNLRFHTSLQSIGSRKIPSGSKGDEAPIPLFQGQTTLDKIDCSARDLQFYGTYCTYAGKTICFTRTQTEWSLMPFTNIVFGNVRDRLPMLPIELCDIVGEYLGEHASCKTIDAGPASELVFGYNDVVGVLDDCHILTLTSNDGRRRESYFPIMSCVVMGNCAYDGTQCIDIDSMETSWCDFIPPPMKSVLQFYTVPNMRTICASGHYTDILWKCIGGGKYRRDWTSRIVCDSGQFVYDVDDLSRNTQAYVTIKCILDQYALFIVYSDYFYYFIYNANTVLTHAGCLRYTLIDIPPGNGASYGIYHADKVKDSIVFTGCSFSCKVKGAATHLVVNFSN